VPTSARPRARFTAYRPDAPIPVRGAAALRPYAVALVLAVALAGCSQPAPAPGDPDDSVAPTVSVPVQPTVLPETPSDETADPSAPVDTDPYDASSSLTGGTCAPTGDVWNFTGTLKNSDTEQHTFSVGVFIVKPDGSEVASREVEVTVAPGATAPVAVRNLWKGPSTGVECLTGVTVKGL